MRNCIYKVQPVILLLFFLAINSFAQVDSLKKDKVFKNTISYNITNTLIFGGSANVLCYERLTGKHQSFSVELGQFFLPMFNIFPERWKANKETEDLGIKFGFDYRFYLANENKYNAPRGIYVGPYYSYNYFNRKNSFMVDTTSTSVSSVVNVSTEFNFQVHTVGAELGYQFVFWKRLAVDLILIGPGISSYSLKTTFDTSLEPDVESELFEAINDKLAEKIPGYSLVIEPGEYSSDGNTNTTSIGFRYLVHLGFRF
jgi:hypothetical protein